MLVYLKLDLTINYKKITQRDKQKLMTDKPQLITDTRQQITDN